MMNWTTVSVSDMLLLDELSKEPCISYLVSRASKVAYLTKYLKGIEDIGFIAGGSIRAAFEGTTPRDIDIFFSSAENHMKAIALFEADKTKKKLYTGKNATAFLMKTDARFNSSEMLNLDTTTHVVQLPNSTLLLLKLLLLRWMFNRKTSL